MIRVIEHLLYEDSLKELVFSLEKRTLQGDFIAVVQYLKRTYKKAGEGLFTRVWSDRTRGNSFKLKEDRFRLDTRTKFFTLRMVRHQHRLPRESQNRRMVGVGRDLCGSSSPTPLPKQGHLQQAEQDRIQAGFEYLQRRRLHNLPGQPVLVLRHPQSEEVLPYVQTELPLLQFVPIAPCPVTGHH